MNERNERNKGRVDEMCAKIGVGHGWHREEPDACLMEQRSNNNLSVCLLCDVSVALTRLV